MWLIPARNRTLFIEDDGGRAAAGYKGSPGDCVTRAIAIASGLPYSQVYDEINALAAAEKPSPRRRRRSSARTGVYKITFDKYIRGLGATWVSTMGIGTGCKVHLRSDELPKGRIIARCSKHLVAVIDGVIHDTKDQSRGGTRCVYGYYVFKSA